MSFESPVIKFDNADAESEQTNNHPGDHSAFSQLNSARSFVLREQQRSSSLPTSHSQIQNRGGGGWRMTQNSYLINLPEDDRRRRSTGSNFYGGKMYLLEGEGLEIFIINNSFLFARYECCQGCSKAGNFSTEDGHK